MNQRLTMLRSLPEMKASRLFLLYVGNILPVSNPFWSSSGINNIIILFREVVQNIEHFTYRSELQDSMNCRIFNEAVREQNIASSN